jgi:hypothetical protein
MSIFERFRGNGPEARTLPADEPTCQGAGLRPTVPSGFDDHPGGERAFAPHCDQRILHAPGECWACDLYPDWQALREKWGIAFTGQAPLTGVAGNQLPCPADHNRPPGSKADHRRWGPNTAQGAHRG